MGGVVLFKYTEVVQFFANTYGGVVADNTFSDCNVVAAGGDGRSGRGGGDIKVR
eukprot:COSAG04_NODE_5008_length_1783_cov_1.540380_2_plen_54_part_00